MIKKILFTILILFSTFFLMENAYAYTYYYDINFQNALDFINSNENIVANDKNPKYYLDYIKKYIDSNNSNNLDYTIIYMYSPTSISFSHYHSFYVLFHKPGSSRSFFLSNGSNNSPSLNTSVTLLHYMSKKVLFTEDTFSNESSLDSTLTELNTILNSSTISGDTQISNSFKLFNQSVNSNISLNSQEFQFVPYFSTLDNPFLFKQYPNDTKNLKDLLVNNILYVFGNYFPTIYNLNNPPVPDEPETPPTFINNSFIPTYNGLFLSNIPKENINNYVAEFSLGRIGDLIDYNYDVNIFGRINHGTYYTYEKIDCSYQITSEEPYYEDFGLQKDFIQYQKKYFEITTCRSDLSNYDNIYVNLYMLNSLKVFNFSSSANYGYVYPNDSFNSRYDNFLDFYSLDSNNALMVSYKSTPNNSYYGSINDTVTSTIYKKENMQKWDYVYFYPIDSKPLKFYKYTDVMPNSTFLLESSTSSDTAYILVDEYTMVSFNDNYKLNNKFTYYEDSNTILENDFIIYQDTNIDDSYDVDNYLTIIKDFLDSLSSDINQFSLVLQNCYDLAPEFIKTIIFVLFILTMSYILFKLIGK